ncbi:hypothetical protein [Nocardioides sp. Root140]|uniref:hypothetical protein n=1 Tax=Nocardioides sp. Root140 TaxID=1736460 RepID=UPI000B235F58|nr:hypothetical protein [Nocardioides sp. Root140]
MPRAGGFDGLGDGPEGALVWELVGDGDEIDAVGLAVGVSAPSSAHPPATSSTAETTAIPSARPRMHSSLRLAAPCLR